MKTIRWTDAASAEDALRQARDEEVLVVRDGHPVAMVLPMDQDEWDWYVREQDANFIKSIAEARKDVAEGHVTRHEDLRATLRPDAPGLMSEP